MEMSPSGSSMQVDRSIKISIPSPEQDRMIAIRNFDWERIKGRVSQMSKKNVSLSVWYQSLFGSAITSGLSIWPVSITKDLPPWVISLYIIFTFGCLLMGGILVWLDRKLGLSTTTEAQNITSDMDKVESLFREPE